MKARLGRTICAALMIGAFTACPAKDKPRPASQPSASQPPATNPCGEVAAAGAPTDPTRHARHRVAYDFHRALGLYDVASDSVRSLRHGDSSYGGYRPRFRNAQTISFVALREKINEDHFFGKDSLFEMDLPDRTVREILRFPDELRAHGWSPGGMTLAYQVRVVSPSDIASSVLCLFDAYRGRTVWLRNLNGDGRSHAVPGDEEALTWSPGGASILFVDTNQQSMLRVFDRKGRDLVRPREGTFARWFPDGRTVLYREVGFIDKPGRWFTLDVRSGRRKPFGMPSGMASPAISPSGKLVAFDDGDADKPSTFLYDQSTGRTRLLIRGHGAPVWLSKDMIAVTVGGPCPERTECNGFWQALGRTRAIDITLRTSRRLALLTTVPDSRVNPSIAVYP